MCEGPQEYLKMARTDEREDPPRTNCGTVFVQNKYIDFKENKLFYIYMNFHFIKRKIVSIIQKKLLCSNFINNKKKTVTAHTSDAHRRKIRKTTPTEVITPA